MALRIVVPAEVEVRLKVIAEIKLYGDTPEKVAENLIVLVFGTKLEDMFLKRRVEGFVQGMTKYMLMHHIQHRTTTYEDPWELVVYRRPVGFATTHISIPLVDGVHVSEANDEFVHLTFYPEKLWDHGVQ